MRPFIPPQHNSNANKLWLSLVLKFIAQLNTRQITPRLPRASKFGANPISISLLKLKHTYVHNAIQYTASALTHERGHASPQIVEVEVDNARHTMHSSSRQLTNLSASHTHTHPVTHSASK